MAAPVIPEAGGQKPDRETIRESLREQVYLDDVDTQLKDQQAKDTAAAAEAETKRKAEAEAKARADATAAVGDDPRVKALQEALRISEEARQRQKALADQIREPPPAEPARELSAEELKKLWDENPLAAIDQMLDRREKILTKNIDARLGGLAASTASSARDAAERKYPDEFKVLAREIDETLTELKNPNLSTMKHWDDFIAFVRGRNFDKVVKAREDRIKQEAAAAAQSTQAATTGAHTSSQIRPGPVATTGDLDDTEKEIARMLNPGMTPEQAYAEHKKWKGVAR
jgi:hypothetical protein